jgi:hypothetical protein
MSEDNDIKREKYMKYMSDLINCSKIEDIKGEDHLEYRLVLEDESLLIEERIFQGYTFSIDELGNIIKQKQDGRTYIQMDRPKLLRGSKTLQLRGIDE